MDQPKVEAVAVTDAKVVAMAVADDSMVVSDPTAVENIQSFVENGNTLIVSDWAGDIVEAAWPDAIEFVENAEQC